MKAKPKKKTKQNLPATVPVAIPKAPAISSALIAVAAITPSQEVIDGLSRLGKTGAPSWFGDLLKFSGKTGQYSAGSQGLPIKEGRVLVAIVPEMLAGHMLWKDGELADQDWLPAFRFDPRDHRATLGDHDKSLWPKDEDGEPTDPWKEARMLPMIDPNTRAEFTFSSSSWGGVKACRQLINTYVKQLELAPETTKGCLPIVALSSESYKPKDRKRGTIFNPVFEGIDWMRASDLTLPSDPGEGEEPPRFRHPAESSVTTMLKTALALIEHGFSVFPCRSRSKVPATAHGFKDASKDPELICRWWTENPRFNVAIATGEPSGVFVVDPDGPDGNAELKKLETQHGELPNTLAVCTANGMHFYFRWPGKPVPCSVSRFAPSIDIRGTGGYCLVPPSIHPTGKRYAWSVDSAKAIATAPDWLVEQALACGGNGKGPAPVSEWRDITANGVAKGCRDDTAARLTGHLLRRSVDAFVTLQLMQSWNLTHCRPPLPPKDIERIVNSIAGRELRKPTNGNR